MKLLFLYLILILLAFSGKAYSSESSDKRDTRPAANQRTTDTDLLERLMKMSPEELRNLRVLIERIESMDSDQRQAMERRVRLFRHHTTEEERREMHRRWKEMSPEERKEFREQIRGRFILRDRDEDATAWEEMTPEERREYLEQYRENRKLRIRRDSDTPAKKKTE